MKFRYVVGCGVDPAAFNRAFEEMPVEEQERIQRVANRVNLTLVMRHQTSIHQNPFESAYESIMFDRWEWRSIEVYLLCTCVDTLAGKAKHKMFPEWLRKRAVDEPLLLKEIDRLHSQYLDEYGVGRTFRQLFDDVPMDVKGWLGENVSIRRSDQSISESSIGTEELIELLGKYFYEKRRNPYTHLSKTRQTWIADDTRIPSVDRWWVTPASGTMFEFRDGPTGETWNFSFRDGLDEATILRVVIHATVLRLLGFEVSEEIVTANLHCLSKIRAVFDFIAEVNWNAYLAKGLLSLGDYMTEMFGESVFHQGIPVMSVENASRMADRLGDNQLEIGMSRMASAYSLEVGQIINETERFNRTHPPSRSIASSDKRWNKLLSFGKRFSPALHSILDRPSRNEITNLWLVLRDPC